MEQGSHCQLESNIVKRNKADSVRTLLGMDPTVHCETALKKLIVSPQARDWLAKNIF